MSEFSSEKTRQSADVEHGPVRQRQPAAVLQDNRASAIQAKTAESASNNAGLPAQLKAGIESLSGMNMDHVNVHYNSSKPAQLQAHAYAQGSEIHLAPGQEKHLPHEAWHVVQQAQGRVKPTMQMKGGAKINDDGGLEREADVMGATALRTGKTGGGLGVLSYRSLGTPVAQLAKSPSDIFDFIDTNRAELGEVQGVQLKRLMYWAADNYFDVSRGGLTLARVKKASATKIPTETADIDESHFPGWMSIRESFALRLPDVFGSGKLNFPKRLENVVFEGRGWISDNVYWRAPGNGVRYMIHAILEWTGENHGGPPTPHITLRNAVTQANIDLDTTKPLPRRHNNQPLRVGPWEPTRTSFSQGLDVNRAPGSMMSPDETTFSHLKSETVQTWLKTLCDKAQAAL